MPAELPRLSASACPAAGTHSSAEDEQNPDQVDLPKLGDGHVLGLCVFPLTEILQGTGTKVWISFNQMK